MKYKIILRLINNCVVLSGILILNIKFFDENINEFERKYISIFMFNKVNLIFFDNVLYKYNRV